MTTENKNELQISRFELHKVADFLPYPFIIAEVINGIHYNTFLNEKFSEEIGYTLEEIPTIEAWYNYAYPDHTYRDGVIRAWDEEEEGNSKQEGKVFVRKKSLVTCKNGMKKWYQIKASVIDKLHVVSFVDLDKEITLQEKLKNINSNNDRMLSVLGHDLRAPLINLREISSMALDYDLSQDDFNIFAERINKQTASVLDMLDTTLNWSRANFNAITISKVNIDIENNIQEILNIYRNDYEAKNIIVKTSFDKAKLKSDSEIVTIIARNMITNSIKFTPQNGEINIGFDNNVLTVSDNGVGMSETMINSILNHQYISNRGTNNEIGMGIGMQLIQNLAEKINAYITIQSQPQKGTLVSLHF
ncbi:MAG: PAS domain-containing sensor histidine kinase [Flavobacterium sp.]|uniref:PAS domain-containing sensor histidine kinase n=1 Tax=Flavobacterium sp. TaxID=239 RepID=UPI0032649DAA